MCESHWIIIQEKPPHKKSMPVTQHFQPHCEDSPESTEAQLSAEFPWRWRHTCSNFLPRERDRERVEASWMKYQSTGWHWGLPPPIESRTLPVYDYIIISSLRLYLTTKLSFPIKPRNLVILFSLPTIRRYSDFKWTGQYITYLSHFLLISSLLFFRCLNLIFFLSFRLLLNLTCWKKKKLQTKIFFTSGWNKLSLRKALKSVDLSHVNAIKAPTVFLV